MKCDSEALGCTNCRLSDHPCKVTNSVDHTYIRGEAQILRGEIEMLQVRIRELEGENAKLVAGIQAVGGELELDLDCDRSDGSEGRRETGSSVTDAEDGGGGESFLSMKVSPATPVEYDECGFRVEDVDVKYDDFDDDTAATAAAADVNADCVGSFLGFGHLRGHMQ